MTKYKENGQKLAKCSLCKGKAIDSIKHRKQKDYGKTKQELTINYRSS